MRSPKEVRQTLQEDLEEDVVMLWGDLSGGTHVVAP